MGRWAGVCRIRGESGEKDRVRITDGEVAHDEMTRADYEAGGFAPPFDELPWTDAEPREAPRPADASDARQQFAVGRGGSEPGPAS